MRCQVDAAAIPACLRWPGSHSAEQQCHQLGALRWPAGRMKGYEMQPRSGDVFIASPPKCGTTWVSCQPPAGVAWTPAALHSVRVAAALPQAACRLGTVAQIHGSGCPRPACAQVCQLVQTLRSRGDMSFEVCRPSLACCCAAARVEGSGPAAARSPALHPCLPFAFNLPHPCPALDSPGNQSGDPVH